MVSNPHFDAYKSHRSKLLRSGGPGEKPWSTDSIACSLILSSPNRDQNTDSETEIPIQRPCGLTDSQATTTCQETGRHRFSDPPTACSLNRCEYPQWFGWREPAYICYGHSTARKMVILYPWQTDLAWYEMAYSKIQWTFHLTYTSAERCMAVFRMWVVRRRLGRVWGSYHPTSRYDIMFSTRDTWDHCMSDILKAMPIRNNLRASRSDGFLVGTWRFSMHTTLGHLWYSPSRKSWDRPKKIQQNLASRP